MAEEEENDDQLEDYEEQLRDAEMAMRIMSSDSYGDGSGGRFLNLQVGQADTDEVDAVGNADAERKQLAHQLMDKAAAAMADDREIVAGQDWEPDTWDSEPLVTGSWVERPGADEDPVQTAGMPPPLDAPLSQNETAGSPEMPGFQADDDLTAGSGGDTLPPVPSDVSVASPEDYVARLQASPERQHGEPVAPDDMGNVERPSMPMQTARVDPPQFTPPRMDMPPPALAAAMNLDFGEGHVTEDSGQLDQRELAMQGAETISVHAQAMTAFADAVLQSIERLTEDVDRITAALERMSEDS